MVTLIWQLVDALFVNCFLLFLFVFVLAYPIAWLSSFIAIPGLSHLIYLLYCAALGFLGHAFFANVSGSEVASPFLASCLYMVSGGVGLLIAIFPFVLFDEFEVSETRLARVVASTAGIVGFVSHSTISATVIVEFTRFLDLP